jgi:hypothetical protein
MMSGDLRDAFQREARRGELIDEMAERLENIEQLLLLIDEKVNHEIEFCRLRRLELDGQQRLDLGGGM